MQKLITLAEQALDDSQNVYLVGAGTWTVGHLKKNVQGKLDDLKRRIDAKDLSGIGNGQLEMLCHMLLTLQAALDGKSQGPERTRLQVDAGNAPPPKAAAPSNVVPFRKQ